MDSITIQNYSIIALQKLLERGIVRPDKKFQEYDVYKYFSAEIGYLTDTYTEEEAERKATAIIDAAYAKAKRQKK